MKALELVLAVGGAGLAHQVGSGDEPGLDPRHHGPAGQRLGDVSFADAPRTEQGDVLGPLDERQRPTRLDLRLGRTGEGLVPAKV